MMYKTVIGNFEVGAEYKAPTFLDANFSTLDKGTAKLKFILSDNKGQRLPLSAVTPKLAMKMSDKSIFVKDDLDIVDPTNGIIEYVLSDSEIKHYGEVQAELYLLYNDKRQASVHKFRFRIDRALIDETVDIIQEFYVSDFDGLKKRLEDKVADLEKRLSVLDNIETKTGAQEKADKAEANAKEYTDVHANNTELHFNPGERDKWNGGQLFKITKDDGQPLVYVNATDDFHELLPRYKGFVHFSSHPNAVNGPGVAVRGFWNCNLSGTHGQVIAFDNSNRTHRKTISNGIWTEWEVLETSEGAQAKVDVHANNTELHFNPGERDKWNNAQLYKFISDDGKRTKLADGTDLLTLPSGFYFAPGHVIQNNPTANDSSWFNYDVVETDQGRKTIYAWRSYDNTIWHSTVHTDGVFKGWKRVVTSSEIEPTWTEVPLKNGAKHGDRKVMCATVGGLLYLKGEIVTNRGVVFGTLPASYRPAQLRSKLVPIFGTTGMTKLYVESNGNMRLEGQISDKLENITSYGLDEIIPL
ncbi:hypothetical protein CHCC15075_1695 [Bacillus licheniformis]|uniref:Phage baseplate upper protein n=1 Tax=Bacillus licheniformis TaxID=1402 RepID=A0AB37GFD3_BACLI|nr:phage baseplate upper protein [Bacillus licheniformis]AYC54157.1 phage tail protein [Bacillus licheniformis]MED1082843.1 phage baseplate upper protein [Bacillus licheniformis]QPR70566.1 phage baseplate upper protein [Bacillus licheniformis]TWL13337.1 hypothetical protein CHCC16874_1860 [Bacillus licheniformis]TWM26231.1 hypothetical protein CHCC15075_1695 [Bacillus licheniformis]